MRAHALLSAFALRALAGTVIFLAALVPGAFAQDDAGNAAAPAQQPPTPIPPVLPRGLFTEPTFLVNGMDYVSEKYGDYKDNEPKSGFYPEFSNMLTGSGWISFGPGYRQYYNGGKFFLDGSAAVSWHLYNMVQGRAEFPKLANEHLVVGMQAMWQDDTQVNYFGIDGNPTESNRSQYRMRTGDIVSYARILPRDWLWIDGGFGYLPRPVVSAPTGTFRTSDPSTFAAYPSDPGVSLPYQPPFLHSLAAVTADTRDHRGYPTSGFMYRAALTNFSDRSTGIFSFNQYEAEALQFVPVVEKRWILALHGWTVHDAVPSGNQVPFYLLPAIGGNNTLRDYLDFQFHDQNSVVVNVESRFSLTTHLYTALFFDAGNVAGQWSDLNFDRRSYGIGFRLHTDTTTIARLDIAQGPQGWHFVFRTTEPLRLSRIRRQIAPIPFAP